MKKAILYIPMMLLALASCEKVQEERIDTPEVIGSAGSTLVVNTVMPDTKVTISPDGDAYKMTWDGDESAKLVERSDAASDAALYSSSAIAVTDGKAAFTFDGLTPVAGTTKYNYDILYPASAVGAASGDVVTLTLPAAQTPLASSADPAAALLAGRNATDFDTQPASVNANFGHLAAYGKMTMKNLSKGSLGSVTGIAITIEAEDCNIAGDIAYNAADGTADYKGSSESVITINGANLTWVYGGFDVWFACKPFTLPAGKKLIITTTLNGTLVQTATMVAKVDVVFKAGEVTEFPAFGTTYTVTFNTNGGSAIAPAYVGRGNKVKQPSNPTKNGSLAGGLYEGEITNPDEVPYSFGGWYKDSGCTTPFDFSTETIYGDTNIYAKWEDSYTPVDVSGQDVGSFGGSDAAIGLAKGIKYVNGQSLDSETHFTYVLDNTAQVWTGSFTTLSQANAVLHVWGKGSERRIYTNNDTNLIPVSAGTMVLEKNLLIQFAKPETAKKNALINISGTGKVRMESNCRIDGSAFNKFLIAIGSSNSEFIMNGGSISGNTAESGESTVAPIGCTWGIFTMNGGTISDNTVTSTSLSANVAGAVLFGSNYSNVSHNFTKAGGSVTGNSAARSIAGDPTGRMGQQVIYVGKYKKIDDNIDSATAVSTGSPNSAPWIDAPVE